MATKNWKLLTRTGGRNHNITEYMNKKNNNFITIINYGGNIGVAVFIRKGEAELDDDTIIKEKSFKYDNNKKAEYESLVYAKSYMRTH